MLCYLKAASGLKHAKYLGTHVRHQAVSHLRKSSKVSKTIKICIVTCDKTTNTKIMKTAVNQDVIITLKDINLNLSLSIYNVNSKRFGKKSPFSNTI